MVRAIDKRIMLDLIIEAKKTDPETGPFSEWLAEYLVDHLPTIIQQNGALAKLKQMEDLVDDIAGAQPEVGGLALEELLTMGTDGIKTNMREARVWFQKRFEAVT